MFTPVSRFTGEQRHRGTTMLATAHCKNATCPPDKKRTRLTDEKGLYLEISPGGSKRWFAKIYLPGDKETRLALGSFPAMGLSAARTARDVVRAQHKGGEDPIAVRKLRKINRKPEGVTFAQVASEMFALKATDWSDTHRVRTERILNTDLVPVLGSLRMVDIDTPMLIAALRRIEARGTLGTLEKARGVCSLVWGYAVATGSVQHNIVGNMRGVFKTATEKHHPAITNPARLGELLRHIRAYQGGPIAKTALQLAPMLFQRPGELRGMAWAELDLDAALWTIPAERMKGDAKRKSNGEPHLVPLPQQAVALLRALHPLTGSGALVFRGEKSHAKPISENTLRVALLALGFPASEQTVHGFRATARTMQAEQLGIDPLVTEQQLAHTVKDALGRAYNRTTYMKQRVTMMQQWADYLDRLAAGGAVVQFKAA
jgi:integrase